MKIHRFALVAVLLSGTAFAQTNTYPFPASGNVGIGTTTPNSTLDVNGDVRVGGAFRVGELYFSPSQIIYLGIGTERWVKLATIPNNHSVRFQLRSGSQNSEEIAEVKVFGTYHNDRTAISVERQTYNEHLREVRVVGADGGARTVFIKIRASDYAPAVAWRALDSRGAITIHNIEETPTGGLTHLVFGNLVTSTNTNLVTTGNVGIGTSSPISKLHVVGDIVAENITAQGAALISSISTNEGGRLRLVNPEKTGAIANEWSIFNMTGPYNNGLAFWRYYADGQNAGPSVFFHDNGNVGIGTTNPTYKLAVNGTIKAKEVIVETTGWSDYVFADGYSLQPLAEVEAHIKTKKHLPGIPSAVEVAEQGVSVGDMQARLLAKIEELTLHQIAQEKSLKAEAGELRALLAAQAEELTALRSEVRGARQP